MIILILLGSATIGVGLGIALVYLVLTRMGDHTEGIGTFF